MLAVKAKRAGRKAAAAGVVKPASLASFRRSLAEKGHDTGGFTNVSVSEDLADLHEELHGRTSPASMVVFKSAAPQANV